MEFEQCTTLEVLVTLAVPDHLSAHKTLSLLALILIWRILFLHQYLYLLWVLGTLSLPWVLDPQEAPGWCRKLRPSTITDDDAT